MALPQCRVRDIMDFLNRHQYLFNSGIQCEAIQIENESRDADTPLRIGSQWRALIRAVGSSNRRDVAPFAAPSPLLMGSWLMCRTIKWCCYEW